MHKLISFYRTLNHLSLDIVAGAVICSLFFAKLLEVTILPYGLIALALTVWCVYTADHLNDAKHITTPASTARHRFHQKYFKQLFIVLMLVAVIDVVMLFFIREQVLKSGMLLGLCVIAYLIIQRYLKFLKEIMVAMLYTSGVLLPSMSVTETQMDWSLIIIILQFVITAFINLILFAWFDCEHDKRDNQTSFVLIVGQSASKKIIWVLLMINVLLSVVLLMLFSVLLHGIILFIMTLMLAIIFWFDGVFKVDDRFRILGDAIFLLPLIYLV